MYTQITDQGIVRSDELMHYGVLGMHWGIRRYQDYGEGGYNPKKTGRFAVDVGRERMLNRNANMNRLYDNAAISLSTTRQIDAAKYKNAAKRAAESLENEENLAKIGRATIAQRVGIHSAGIIATGAAFVATASATSAFAPAVLAAAVPAGIAWVAHYKSTQ